MNLRHLPSVNNEIYENLGTRWYEAEDDPVALLRAEARLRNPWICKKISEEAPSNNTEKHKTKRLRVLDIGCGAGFLSNALALAGHEVVGIDLSQSSLSVAKAYDRTNTVRYREADATHLPFEDESFDAVCSTDLLEHLDSPQKMISEASRVLKPGGKFFLHTFSRNPLSWLLAIKALEWFVKNTPRHLHVYHLFIRPSELKRMCQEVGLKVEHTVGLKPVIFNKATLKLLLTGRVPPEFQFEFTRMTFCSYLCLGRKTEF